MTIYRDVADACNCRPTLETCYVSPDIYKKRLEMCLIAAKGFEQKKGQGVPLSNALPC